MSRERRFGLALTVLALGNAMLALGNYVADGEMTFVALEALMAVLLGYLGYSFVYGNSELTIAESRERLVAISTALIAAVGLFLAAAGFYLAALA